jgi:alpha-tubulin suppressor-like RCC1 family protein
VRGQISKMRSIGWGAGNGVVRLVALLALGAALLPARGNAASFGQLYGFGDNRFGQLGNTTNNRTSKPNPTPMPVTLPGEVGPVTQAATGGYFSLALTSTGQLYAFGENYYGQLGNPDSNLEREPNPTPTPVTLPGATGPITQVAAGSAFSLAVTASGQLYAFGNNLWGQLGNATNDGMSGYEANNPTPTLVTLPGETGPVTQAAAGGPDSLALTSTGQLYAFGENFWGQLGNTTGANTPNPTPTLVTLPGEVGPVTQVAAGEGFSLAVTAGGQLYAWGENINGELGNETNNLSEELKPNPTPTPVTLPGATGPVAQVAAGTAHTLALTSTGQLYAFGYNSCGELGNTTNNRTWAANPTPTRVGLPGASGRITHIAAGDEYSLALTSTGQLYAFGCDVFGELGAPPGEELLEPHPTPQQVAMPGGARVETMATGAASSHTLVILDGLSVANSSLPSGELGLPYSTQAQGTGGAAPYTWSAAGLPPGLSIDPENGAISGTPTTPGTYTAIITPTDGAGIEAPTPLTIKVKGPYEPPPPPGENEKTTPSAPSTTPTTPSETPPPSGPSGGTPSPLVQGARQSATRWREGNPLAHHIRQAKIQTGTTFSFSLNEQATVSLSFRQLMEGRRSAHGCIAETRENRQRKRCSYVVTRGTLSLTGHSGINEVLFAGRISRIDELKPGRYELIITATSSAGQRSTPVSLSFTIMR